MDMKERTATRIHVTHAAGLVTIIGEEIFMLDDVQLEHRLVERHWYCLLNPEHKGKHVLVEMKPR